MEFRLLGPLEVSAETGPLRLGGAKQRGLLALLLLRANRVVGRDQLVEAVWGDAVPRTIASELHVYLSKLRRLLGSNGSEARLLTRSGGYILEVDPDRLDLHCFEQLFREGRRSLAAGRPAAAAARLGEALALWRGPALADLTGVAFAAAEAARLEGLRLAAIEDRIEADLALGRHADVALELDRLVAEHPYRERLRGQLMLTLYRSGRQSEALRAFRDGRRLLLEDLGMEPGADLRRLELAMLREDPELDLADGSSSISRQRSTSAAEMHERFAAWLEQRGERESPDWEHLLAHHLEQAFRHYEEAGMSSKAAQLGQRAALLLARSGRRALDRSDVRSATRLLARARSLSSPGGGRVRRLAPALGESLLHSGDIAGAYAVLTEAADLAAGPDERATRTLALVLASYVRAHVDPAERTQLARTAENALDLFEAAGDDSALARILAILTDTGLQPPAQAVHTAELAHLHAARAGDARLEAEAAAMACKYAMLGTAPVPSVIARVEETLAWAHNLGNPGLEARLLGRLAWLAATRGRPAEARRLVAQARATMSGLGHELAAAGTATVAAHVELLAGNAVGAERQTRSALRALEAMGDVGSAGTLAALLARALVLQGRAAEALPLAERAARAAYAGDVIEQVEWRLASALALGQLGRTAEAVALASEAVDAAAGTELIALHAQALAALAGTLKLAGRRSEVAPAAEKARSLFERKGDALSARRAAELIQRD